MDRVVSCLALVLLILLVTSGFGVLGYQVLDWLQTGIWSPMPLAKVLGFIRGWGEGWVGLQQIYDWILALPLSLILVFVGFLTFGLGGNLSAYLYRRAAVAERKPITPAQTHA